MRNAQSKSCPNSWQCSSTQQAADSDLIGRFLLETVWTLPVLIGLSTECLSSLSQLKKELVGQHFQTWEELISAVTNISTKLEEDFYSKKIQDLVTGYNKCWDRHCNNVEK